jgi:hypothetical protein
MPAEARAKLLKDQPRAYAVLRVNDALQQVLMENEATRNLTVRQFSELSLQLAEAAVASNEVV